MGRDKALIVIGEQSLLEHTLGILGEVCESVVIVGDRPAYHRLGVPVVADDHPHAGPLGGIATALRVAGGAHVLCVACDMPELSAPLLRAMAAEPRDYDALVPVTGTSPERRRLHPLHAVYSPSVRDAFEQSLASGRLAVVEALQAVTTRYLDEAWLRRFDPHLYSLVNLNTPAELEEYSAGQGGIETPNEVET